MAMSKEQQREAARRIIEKEPLTEEEEQIREMLSKTPEQYRVPTNVRECGNCGAEFQDETDAKGVVVKSALEQFSDHQSSHNPSPGQWAEAHKRIEAGKEKLKASEKSA